MRRANVGNLLGIKSVMLLVLTCVLFSGVGPALAQSVNLADLEFLDLNLEIRNNAEAAEWQVISASSILAASDESGYSTLDGGFIDGRFNTDSAQVGTINNAQLFTVGSERDPQARWAMSRPLLGNAFEGQPLQLISIIKNVPTEFIDGLRDGSIPADDVANNAILASVTADFSKGLFTESTPASVYTGVHPNYVTSVVDISSVLFTDEGDRSNAESSMVLVLWSSPDLVVGATDFPDARKGVARQSYCATIAIDKGILAKHQQRSNFVGVETGQSSQPQFLVSDDGYRPQSTEVGEGWGIKVVEAVDYTGQSLWGLLTAPILDPSIFLSDTPSNDKIPFQFRGGDGVRIRLQIVENRTLDGEPNEYFGTNGSDEIASLTADGKGEDGSTGMEILFDTNLINDLQNVIDPGTIEFQLLGAAGPVDSKQVDITGLVASSLITSGSFRIFSLDSAIVDEVNSVTPTIAHHFVDTAAPMVTAMSMKNEIGGVADGHISSASAGADQAIVTLQVDGNGERTNLTNLQRWMNITVDQTWLSQDGLTRYDPVTHPERWFDPAPTYNVPVPLSAVPSSGVPISANFEETLISTIPSNNPNILGAQVTIRLQNNTSFSVRSAGVVMSVSDDARNPAMIFTSPSGSGGSPLLDTTLNRYAVKFNPVDGVPVAANELKKSTVVADNIPPVIVSADFYAAAMPVGYWSGIDSFSDTGQSIFGLLRKTFENVALNTDPLEVQRRMYRGTAAYSDGYNNYNGSPVRLVVQFRPVDPANPRAAEDDDSVVPGKSVGVDLVRNRFTFSITNADLGYTSFGEGVNKPVGHWDIVDATVIPDGVGGMIGYATFADLAGIPGTLDPGTTDSREQLQVVMTDTARTPSTAANSNNLIVDNLSPKVNFVTPASLGSPWNTVVDGRNLTPDTGLLIANTNGQTITQLGFDPDTDPITDLELGGWVNAAANGAAVLQAGNMIILKARFDEIKPGAPNDANALLDLGGVTYRLAGFPFVFNTEDAGSRGGTAADLLLDAAGTLYGQQFRTLSADFGSFVTESSARDVIPDQVRIVAGTFPPGLGAGDARANDTIEATWFYVISPDATLNANIAPSQVRSVTLTARDLSGRKTVKPVPVAKATFIQPLVTILNYEINIPNRGIANSVIQRDSSYLGGVNDGVAYQISSATSNLNNATVFLVAKIGDGVSRGGPFTRSEFIKADFTALGGGVVLPMQLTDSNGNPVTDGTGIASDKILWATFVGGPFTETSADSGAKADKKVKVTATAATLGVGLAETDGIQVDMTAPDVQVSQVEEIDENGRETNPFGDLQNDAVVRPGQVVSVTATFATDLADRANLDLIQWTPDFSQFGVGISPIDAGLDFPGDLTAGIRYTFTVPLTAQTGFVRALITAMDAAGNKDLGQSDIVTINASAPTVQSTILSASSVVNYATDKVRPNLEYYEVGRRLVNIPDELLPDFPLPSDHTSWPMVRAGDEIKVEAVLSINDPAFSSLNLSADFSEFSGPDYASVVPSTTPVVSGNIVRATWFHRVQAAGSNIVNASVKIHASNPAGIVASGTVTQTVPMTVDKTAPEVVGQLFYFAGKDNQPFTGSVLNSNQEFVLETPETHDQVVMPVTAALILTATWTDTSTEYGYLDGVVAALLKDGKSISEAIAELFRLNDADEILASAPQPTFWVFTDKQGVITDQGSATDGPIITSASFPDQAAVAESFIKKGTHSVLNVWYGVDPRNGVGNNTLALKKVVAKNNARLIFEAMDVIGNKSSYVLQPQVTIDGSAPVIASRFIGSVTLDVAADQVPWVNYIPAIYSGENIIRPTRVTQGSKLSAKFWMGDAPNPDAPLALGIVGTDAAKNVKAANITIVSPTESAITGNFTLAKGGAKEPDGNSLGVLIDPSQIPGDAFFVQVDFTVNADKETNNPDISTFPYNTSSVGNALSPANYNTVPANLSSIIFDATDQVGNTVSGVKAFNGVEVDMQGPGLIHQTIVLAGDLDQVNALNGAPAAIPQGQALSARAGNWIIWCATYVVDGTEDGYFPLDQFDINWTAKLEFDVDRLVPNSNVKGKKYFVQSATRSIIFVTNAVQVKSDADPRDPAQLTVSAYDFFGNKTETTSPFIGISSGGPIATEITLTVDGKSQQIVGGSNLGIGAQGPDIKTTAFEIYPGAKLVVEATITPINGEAPDTILLDVSDFYPAGLKPMVDEVPPSEQILTTAGTIYAKWENVTYDFKGVTDDPFPAAARLDAKAASTWFFDQSNLNYILFGLQVPVGTHPRDVGGISFNGPVDGSVPTSSIVIGGASAEAGATGRGGAYFYAVDGDPEFLPTISLQGALDNLIGLPLITVQPNALAKRVAWVTVTVDDETSLFAQEKNYSTFFTVDTRPPRASYVYNVESRALPPAVVDENGFPAAVNTAKLRDNTLPRVRGGDAVAVIVEITNAMIDKTGNDLFRPLPGLFPENLEDAFFAIEAGNSASIGDVTADLAELSSAVGMDNVSGNAAPNEIAITSRGENQPDKILATYHVQVTPDKGNTVVTSNLARSVTPTVVDDAGNAPRNTAYTTQTLRSMTPMAVDNTPPSISGNVEVVLLDGSATTPGPNPQQLGPGSVVPDGSVIAAGALLSVTVQVTDLVDHPLDIVNALNYGETALRTQGLKVEPANIALIKENAKLSGGSDSIRVPFTVLVPSAEDGKSTFAFKFIIEATDTIGNGASRVSIESFSFDANPDVTFADAGGNTLAEPVVAIANAGAPFNLSANALDVGGIKSVQWTADTTSEGVGITSVDEDGTTHDDLLWTVDPARQRARLDLVVNAPVNAAAINPVLAKVLAVDIEDNENLNAEQTVTININQPPIIADSLALTETNDAAQVTTVDLVAPEAGLGYNTAFADIREVTIAEGSVMNLDIVATDANGDPIVFSATGTAMTTENVVGTLTDNGDGTGAFSFAPGYLAVVGDNEAAQFELDLSALGTNNIAPDTMKLLVNVTAKSATPVITVVSASVNDVEVPVDREQIQVIEGQTLKMLVRGVDPGKETTLSMDVPTNPEGVVFSKTITSIEQGTIEAQIEYTPGPTDADVQLVGYDSAIDPFVFQFQVKNASAEAELLRTVDIINESQAPLVQTTASVNGGTPVTLADGGSVTANPGESVVFNIKATDPDGDAVQFPQDPIVTAGAGFTTAFQVTNIQAFFIESMLTIGIPAEVATEDSLVAITFTATDITNQSRTVQYTIQVQTGGVITPIDELLVAQGDGGITTVNYRNLDAGVTEIDGKTVAVTSVYRAFAGSAGTFAARNGGGLGRATYVANGDVNGDGLVDTLVTVGPVKAGPGEFNYPNIVIPREADVTNGVIGHSFMAFPVGTDDLPVNYSGGEVRAVIGNFLGTTPAQIAVAQGFGGKHVVRVYQYTGEPAPNGYGVVAQFTGLVGGAQTNNANGGMVLAAGDLNGDGKDDLVIGQTNSETSRTQFQSVSFNEDGSIASRASGVAFPRKFQGNGGVEMAVADLDGNGLNEIVFTSAGNTRDFPDETEDGRNTAPLSVMTVMIPQLDSQGNVHEFVRATGIPVIKVYNDETNPSGAMSVAALEADGDAANGSELVVGTGAVYQINGFDITAVNPAPTAKYSLVKLGFDGANITGLTAVTGIGGQPAVGRNAFPEDLDPTSGAIFVSGGNTDGPGSGVNSTPTE